MSKIYDKYDNALRDGKLTHLMIIKKGNRNYTSRQVSYPLYCLLKSFLEDYGIYMGGATEIYDYEVRAVAIDSSFNLENEPVLKEIYAFTNGRVNIPLHTDLNKDCAYAFWYDLKTYACTWIKYEFGDEKECYEFSNLADLLEYLKKREAENE